LQQILTVEYRTVEKVDDTVADIQDQFDVANQISDAIASFSNEAEDVCLLLNSEYVC